MAWAKTCWLKHIDAQLEDTMGQLLADADVTRRQWQILNTIAAGPHSMAEIDEAAKPFLSSETPTFRAKAIEGLTNEEYVALVTLLERVATNVATAR